MNLEKPDISQINEMKIREREFPLKHEYRIVISKHAYELIYNEASLNNSVEICGVLIGDVFKDIDGPYLEITDIIKGEYADNQAGEVKFTHETWSHINVTKDSEFMDMRIVGWYHSHPSFGIFLSDQDMFIHRNFFNQPWQVAFVIDPITHDDGFFFWDNGSAARSNYYWIDGILKKNSHDVDHSQIKAYAELDSKIMSLSKGLKKVLKPYQFIIVLIVIIILFILNYDLINKSFYNSFHTLKQSMVVEQLQIAEDLQKIIAENQLLSDLNIKITRKGNHIWCSGEVYTLHQKELVGKVIGSVKNIESVDLRGIIVTHSYKVLLNETLGDISKRIYGYSDRWVDIFEMNKNIIDNPNKILPHTTLVLPE